MTAIKSSFAALIVACLAVGPSKAHACSSSNTYRSVILNTIPTVVPEQATVLRVEVTTAYVAGDPARIKGIRGRTVDPVGSIHAGTQIEVRAVLSSMCDTWVEQWSDDHDVTDGVITGHIVARVEGEQGGRLSLWPALFRRKAGRTGALPKDGWWLYEVPPETPENSILRKHAAILRSREPEAGGVWAPLRIDAEALAKNLEETNRLIREDLERRNND